jgi:hypothetical protein
MNGCSTTQGFVLLVRKKNSTRTRSLVPLNASTSIDNGNVPEETIPGVTTNLGYLLKAYHELKFSQHQISPPPYVQKPWNEFREEYPEMLTANLIVCDVHSEINGK